MLLKVYDDRDDLIEWTKLHAKINGNEIYVESGADGFGGNREHVEDVWLYMCMSYVCKKCKRQNLWMKVLTAIVIVEKHLSQTKCTNESEHLFMKKKNSKTNDPFNENRLPQYSFEILLHLFFFVWWNMKKNGCASLEWKYNTFQLKRMRENTHNRWKQQMRGKK